MRPARPPLPSPADQATLCARRRSRAPVPHMPSQSNRIIVTVIGKDQVGIIAAVATVLADARVNIVDISQTTLREFFAMILMGDMAEANVPFDEIKRRLNEKGDAMGLKIDAQHEDVFKYMHRV
jgi:ACT domain-containing protein